jgi:hypothetical protein
MSEDLLASKEFESLVMQAILLQKTKSDDESSIKMISDYLMGVEAKNDYIADLWSRSLDNLNAVQKIQMKLSVQKSLGQLSKFKTDSSLENIIQFIEVLTQAILNKEKLIKQRHKSILKAVETELLENQKPNKFEFGLPTIQEIERVGRLDTNLYGKHFKRTVFEIQNYENGFQTINELGFTLSRGQNLQVSNIGESIYSTKKHPNFYTLMLPKFLSKYGTVDTIEYLGNPNKLKTCNSPGSGKEEKEVDRQEG